MIHHEQESKCPECGVVHQLATCPKHLEAVPGVGDLTVCIVCGAFARWDENMKPVLLTQDEFNALSEDVRVQMSTAARFIWLRGRGK